jgi:Ni,Fe-hydrogenase I cytochrome b subunit
MKRKIYTALATTIGMLASSSLVNAQAEIINSGLKSQIQTKTGLGDSNPVQIAATMIGYFLTILGILSVGIIIYGGFKWMTAGGNEESVKKARGTLTAATIGLVVILSSYSIALYVFSVIENSTGQTTF